MPATNQNVTHWKGDDGQIRITVRDADGNAVDLTDATARWWVGKAVTSIGDDIVIQKGTEDGGIVITEDDGLYTLTIELQPEDTEELTAGRYYHECEVVDAAGDISTVSVGKFVLKPTLIPDELT